MPNDTAPYLWRFFRAGEFDQVRLESGADLAHLDQLDQKLWVALACPITGLEFDPKTAALIDTDNDGRIRAPELLAAVNWACAVLKHPDTLIRGSDALDLNAINDQCEEGKLILASARRMLANLGLPANSPISLAQAMNANLVFAAANFNGDGVIVAECAYDSATAAVFAEIADCLGAVPDRSGKPGIDQPRVDAFFAACAAFDAWSKSAETDAGTILPIGAATAAAAEAVRAVKPKVDDFFGRCRLAAFDPRSVTVLNRTEDAYIAIAATQLSIDATAVAAFPLAQVAPGKPLALQSGLNPAHAAAVATFVKNAVQPLLGNRTELTEADWATLQNRLAPFEAWQAAKAGSAVEKLGLPRIRALLAGKSHETLNALIAEDKAVETEAASSDKVEKLLRYVRDLHLLCRNFVNFTDLYQGNGKAIFQCGTLYLDQRACFLCLTVEDAARHATMAGLSGAYLAYCDCLRKGTNEKLSVVAVVSQGDDDNLMVGRNGIFYDRKGRDYDATIMKIVTSPISLRQAFWLPYKKGVRSIEEFVAKRATAAETETQTQLAAATTAAPATAAPGTPAKPLFDPSVVALLSLAVGSLAAGAATVFTALGKVPPPLLPFVLGGIALAISAPSLLLAFIKLRKRNLGPILDANGWAINAKAKINVPFGERLTVVARLPRGAIVEGHDRFAQKPVFWPKLLGVLLFLVWIYSLLCYTNVLPDEWQIKVGNQTSDHGDTNNVPSGRLPTTNTPAR